MKTPPSCLLTNVTPISLFILCGLTIQVKLTQNRWMWISIIAFRSCSWNQTKHTTNVIQIRMLLGSTILASSPNSDEKKHWAIACRNEGRNFNGSSTEVPVIETLTAGDIKMSQQLKTIHSHACYMQLHSHLTCCIANFVRVHEYILHWLSPQQARGVTYYFCWFCLFLPPSHLGSRVYWSHHLLILTIEFTNLCFQNIQSTNWQSLRFKPPPPKSDIGWRVEFRVCEVCHSWFTDQLIVSPHSVRADPDDWLWKCCFCLFCGSFDSSHSFIWPQLLYAYLQGTAKLVYAVVSVAVMVMLVFRWMRTQRWHRREMQCERESFCSGENHSLVDT